MLVRFFFFILKELFDSGLRLNSRPPNGSISKTGLGGIEVISTVSQEIEEDAIKSVVREYGIVNAQVVLREKITLDDLVDILEYSGGNKFSKIFLYKKFKNLKIKIFKFIKNFIYKK